MIIVKFFIINNKYSNFYYKKLDKIIKRKNSKKINIIYENENYLVLNKGYNISMYSLKHNNTVLSFLYFIYNESIFNVEKCGILSRIDFDVSGITVIAKKNNSYNIIKKKFISRNIKKYYIVIVKKNKKKRFSVNIFIKKGIFSFRKKKLFKYSKSIFENIIDLNNYNKKYSIMLCKILTGRYHQIKISLKSKKIKILIIKKKYLLHSWKLSFRYLNENKTYYSINNKYFLNIFIKNNIKFKI
ncbi:pseudouridine synthase [Candidatus Vidania fulgoroideorum]